MNPPPSGHRRGFTLVEVMIASTVLVIAVTMAMSGFVYVLRTTRQRELQQTLDIAVQKSMEYLKRDIRLSALEKMVFWPATGATYTALSFPMALDSDGDGAVELGTDGKILWDRTVVYHVWPAVPNELRRTIFYSRDNTLTGGQRLDQLISVVTNGHGRFTYEGTNTTTRAIFKNLFMWKVNPRAGQYDGYASARQPDPGYSLGTCILSNGNHTFTFRVIGKNSASTNYAIGIDSLVVSPCGGTRQGEAQLPATAVSGPSPTNEYMPYGSWSGNYQLSFPATATGQYFTLTMENDRWEQTFNFRETDETHSNTTLKFDTTLNPKDFVVCLNGKGGIFYSSNQTGDPTGDSSTNDSMADVAVRVLVKGQDMADGSFITVDGGQCRIDFRSSYDAGKGLKLDGAWIGECASRTTPSMDVVPGTQTRLKLAGGNTIVVPGNSDVVSDQVAFGIDAHKSYLVTLLINKNWNWANPWQWTGPVGVTNCYLIPASSNPDEGAAQFEMWSARPDVLATNVIYGLQYIYATYPTNACYISQPIDTRVSAPSYSQLNWNAVEPTGTDVIMKFRTGNSNDMSDAGDWASAVSMSTPGSFPSAPPSRRYCQFMAQLKTDTASGSNTPLLKDVTIRWPGEAHAVDISGNFVQAPGNGIFELTVDGQPLKRGIIVNLQIYDDVPVFGRGVQRLTSSLTSEIVPRNTGK